MAESRLKLPKKNRTFIVLKSKSSNTTMRKPGDPPNKKGSSSYGEVQQKSLKKRGLYVEKKSSYKPPLNQKKNTTVVSNVPPRPKAGAKTFMNSVLNILSKSSTSTQYPERIGKFKRYTPRSFNTEPPTESLSSKNISRDHSFESRRKMREKAIKTANADGETTAKLATEGKSYAKKYRSVVLKNMEQRKKDVTHLVVLQDKRELIQTPSMNSDRECASDDTCAQGILKESIKSVLERKNFRIYQDHRLEQAKQSDHNQVTENSEGLYKMFADVLDEKVNAYDYDDLDEEHISKSENANVVDNKAAFSENVAKKLRIQEPNKENLIHFDSLPSIPQFVEPNVFEINEPKINSINYEMDNKRTPSPPPKTKKLLRKKTPKLPMPLPSQKTTKQSKKRAKINFINMLKEQLSAEVHNYREPNNIYQALKQIAKNKRKYQKIQFQEPQDYECKYKRNKFVSEPIGTDRSKYTNEEFFERQSKLQNEDYQLLSAKVPINHSIQSLKVYEMDFESSAKYDDKAKKVVLLTYQTSDDDLV